MTAPTCKHCFDVLLTRDRYDNGDPKNQQTTEWRAGTVTLHEIWSCPRCSSTFLLNGVTRPMTTTEARELDILVKKYGVT